MVMGRGAVAAVVLLSMLVLVPADALPVGPPTIWLETRRTGPTTYALTADVHDPDGPIASIEICAEDVCAATSFDPPDALGAASACLTGNARSFEVQHTFAPGSYEITVTATAGGCPVIGADETVTRTFSLEVETPPEPPEPVVCADEQTPVATAPGVDAERVTLGATVSLSGPAAQSGVDVYAALSGAARAVNDAGGICGRELHLNMVDDGSNEGRRYQSLIAFMDEGEVFGIVGSDVSSVIADGSIEAAQVPAVGTPAARANEFGSPWVWPIGAGNHAFGRIAVAHALDEGASTFALVSDADRSIGRETAEAVRAAIAATPGASLEADEEISDGSSSYGEAIQAFNVACADGCDAVIYAVEPTTLLTWLAGHPARGQIVESAHPASFREGFASACGSGCDGMMMWADAHPAAGEVPVETTRACWAMRGVRPSADCMNPQALAAYQAVWLVARAMGAVGTDLTRPGLRDALDHGSFSPGVFGGPLIWTPSRHANRWLRGYSIVVASGSFAGYREETGWLEDPQT